MSTVEEENKGNAHDDNDLSIDTKNEIKEESDNIIHGNTKF